MSKGFKILVIIVVILFTIGITFYFLLDYIAQRTIEDQASQQTGVDVTLNSVAIGIFSGKIALRQLVINNPPGYQSQNLLVIPTTIAQTDLSSVWSNTVQVHSLTLESPVLHVELKQALPPESNLGQVIDNIKRNRPSPQEQANQRKYIIDYARIENTKIDLIQPDGSTTSATLPPIELKDIKSSEGGGVILSDVIGQILSAIAQSIASDVQNLPQDLGKSLQQAGEELQRQLEREFKGIFGGNSNK